MLLLYYFLSIVDVFEASDETHLSWQNICDCFLSASCSEQRNRRRIADEVVAAYEFAV